MVHTNPEISSQVLPSIGSSQSWQPDLRKGSLIQLEGSPTKYGRLLIDRAV